MSLDLALVPDCGGGCVNAYGRFMEKHIKTQNHHPFLTLPSF